MLPDDYEDFAGRRQARLWPACRAIFTVGIGSCAHTRAADRRSCTETTKKGTGRWDVAFFPLLPPLDLPASQSWRFQTTWPAHKFLWSHQEVSWPFEIYFSSLAWKTKQRNQASKQITSKRSILKKNQRIWNTFSACSPTLGPGNPLKSSRLRTDIYTLVFFNFGNKLNSVWSGMCVVKEKANCWSVRRDEDLVLIL